MKLKLRYWIILLTLTVILGIGLFTNQQATSVVSDAKVQHVIERLSFGAAPGDLTRVQAQGIESYIKEQLSPENISESRYLTEQLNQLETLNLDRVQLFNEYATSKGQQRRQLSQEERMREFQKLRKVPQQAIEAHLLRSIYSSKQLEEVMVNFWFNHFNVYLRKGRPMFLWVGDYENTAIRPHVFGNFRDLLEATATHPAMLYYLDNWRNTAPEKASKRGAFRGLNENYAREIMELHTLGVDAGYSQEDVVTLARILTGWGISPSGNGEFYFDEKRHDYSDKVFLGVSIKGSGIAEVEQALDILAKHPATANHIGYKLAQYFVADEPPQSLITKLSESYISTDGDIRSVLTTLFNSSEFLDSQYYEQKFKTPYQFVISTVRATGVKNPNLKRIQGMLKQLNMMVYDCPTPDGYKNTQQAWLNPDGMLRRLSFTTAIANGRLELDKNQNELIDAQQLINTLGNNFSEHTQQVLQQTPPKIQGSIILGSPEMMYR